MAICPSGDEPTYRSIAEHCRFVSGASSGIALAGFITMRNPLRTSLLLATRLVALQSSSVSEPRMIADKARQQDGNRLSSAAKLRQQTASGDNPKFVHSINRPKAAKRRQKAPRVAISGLSEPPQPLLVCVSHRDGNRIRSKARHEASLEERLWILRK